MDLLRHILDSPATLVLLIGIIVFVASAIVACVALWIKHRERIAMINQGIHPDYPPDEVEGDNPSGP